MKPSLCLTILALPTLACGDRPPPNGHSPALEAAVRDGAGGGHGIRSHGLIVNQGVSRRFVKDSTIVI